MRRSRYWRGLSRAAQLRRHARHRRAKCNCSGWPFPHRAGSRRLSGDHPGCLEVKAKW